MHSSVALGTVRLEIFKGGVMIENVVAVKTGAFGPDIDLERSRLAYEPIDNGRVDVLQQQLDENFLQASDTDIDDPTVEEFIRSGKALLIVPMREKGSVIRPLLTTLVMRVGMDPRRILVVNDGSDEEAVEEALRNHTVLIDRDEVLECVHWNKLLPVLNLCERPRGKGVAVLAGYLLSYCMGDSDIPEWIFHNDAEIRGYAKYRGLEYLVWGMLQEPAAEYVKIAKAGRGNERCIATRCMMDVLAESSFVNEAIRQRARQIFNRLVRHKWMLTGEFGFRFEVAMARPLATGYLEETLAALYCEDRFARGAGCTVQVANPHPRDDGNNDERKESIMQQQVSNFLLMMALEADPTDQWGLPEIARLNSTCMSRPIRLGWIASGDEPVRAELIKNDRIIPSVQTLVEGGFVDVAELKQLVGEIR